MSPMAFFDTPPSPSLETSRDESKAPTSATDRLTVAATAASLSGGGKGATSDTASSGSGVPNGDRPAEAEAPARHRANPAFQAGRNGEIPHHLLRSLTARRQVDRQP